MAEKVTRKQLLKEPDEFMTLTGRLIRFGSQYKKEILSFVGAICVLFLIITGYRYFAGKNENAAFAELQKTLAKYDTLLKDKDLEKGYKEIKGDFETILNQYSGNQGGKLARVIFANICYNGNDPDKAIELYQQSLEYFNQQPNLKNFIVNGLAYAYAKKKDNQNAIKYFEMITSDASSIMKDDANFNLGRLYAQADDKDKSKAAYEKIITNHPEYMYIDIVKEKMPK